MGLASFTLPTETITLPRDQTMVVRGLSFEDITILVKAYGGDLTALFSQMASGQGELALTDTTALVAKFFNMAPLAAAHAIALAADAPEYVEAARRLPLPVQLDAIEKIAALTFEVEGGPKKVLETVIRIAQGTTEVIQGLQTSGIGSGVFAGR